MVGWRRSVGEPESVQKDLHLESRRQDRLGWLLLGAQDVLVLDPVLDAVGPNVTVPLVALEPTVLYDVRPATAVTLERLEHGDVVRVAHADLADDARVLQGDERAPSGERLGECAEGRV